MSQAKLTEQDNTQNKKKSKAVFSRSQLCIPYALFLLLFVVFPLMLIIYYAFTSKTGQFTFDNFVWFFSTDTNIKNLFFSMGLGVVTTIICLLIGYPVALVLAKMKSSKKTILLLLFIMPMWINFVLRAMAMKELLSVLGLFGKYNYLNTVIGMVYDYLPFMILPLYTTLIKIDKSYEEAALDLGASPFKVFMSITLPLSLPGIISGIMMVFLPSMTCYVISDTFSNGKILIIGQLIELWFGDGSNWNYGSTIALIMLVIMYIGMLVSGKFSEDENVRGTNL